MSFVARRMIFEIGVKNNERKSAGVSAGYIEHFSFIFLKSYPKSILRSRKAFGNTPNKAFNYRFTTIMNSNHNIKTSFQACKQHVWTEIGEEAILLNVDQGQYYELDPIGNLIWKSLQTPQNLTSVHKMICSNFEVSEEQCLNDIKEFVSELVNAGLIEELISDNGL